MIAEQNLGSSLKRPCKEKAVVEGNGPPFKKAKLHGCPEDKDATDPTDTLRESCGPFVSCDFAGKDLSKILVIEVFAGTARLTRAIRDAGMSGLAIDKDNQRTQQVHICVYDLNDDDQFHALLTLIRKEKDSIVLVHFAPSRGTASRAREKPLPKLEKMGFDIPQPLRSSERPLGLDGLAGRGKIKTESANITYDHTAKLCRELHSLGIAFSIENPQNSRFWDVPCILTLITFIGGFWTTFDNCCHGGTRPKATAIWANVDWFQCLEARCDNSHYHEKWNPKITNDRLSFPTHQEAAYPILLCQRIAAIIKQKALQFGAVESTDLSEQLASNETTSHTFLLGVLPKGKRYKPLASEFGSYVKLLVPPNFDPIPTTFWNDYPKGTKCVHRQFLQGISRADEGNLVAKNSELDGVQLHHSFADGHSSGEILTLGIPREPLDFLARAVQVGHPRSLAIHLLEHVKEMLKRNFGGSLLELAKVRTAFLWRWSRRAKDLAQREAELHSSMPLHLRDILKGKRLLLFKEILDDLNYPDSKVALEIANGFTLHGWMPESNVFPRETKRPEYDLRTVQNV